ncbi:MAG: hypothetical protein V4804_04500 [Pseudomonadota bacterium]|jgi:hypothetical protein
MTDTNKGRGAGNVPALSVLTYDLTADDLAAWVRRSRRAKKRVRQSCFAAFLMSAALLRFAGGRVTMLAGVGSGAKTALIVGLLVLPVLLTYANQMRGIRSGAVDDLPHPVTARLEIDQDRLREYRADRTVPVTVSPKLVHRVLLTKGHLFIESGSNVVILPARAFPDRTAMRTLADDWTRISTI